MTIYCDGEITYYHPTQSIGCGQAAKFTVCRPDGLRYGYACGSHLTQIANKALDHHDYVDVTRIGG